MSLYITFIACLLPGAQVCRCGLQNVFESLSCNSALTYCGLDTTLSSPFNFLLSIWHCICFRFFFFRWYYSISVYIFRSECIWTVYESATAWGVRSGGREKTMETDLLRNEWVSEQHQSTAYPTTQPAVRRRRHEAPLREVRQFVALSLDIMLKNKFGGLGNRVLYRLAVYYRI